MSAFRQCGFGFRAQHGFQSQEFCRAAQVRYDLCHASPPDPTDSPDRQRHTPTRSSRPRQHHLKPVGLDEDAQFGVVVAGVQVLQAGVGIVALADEAFGFGDVGGIDSIISDRAKWLVGGAFHPGTADLGDRPHAAQLIAAEAIGLAAQFQISITENAAVFAAKPPTIDFTQFDIGQIYA